MPLRKCRKRWENIIEIDPKERDLMALAAFIWLRIGTSGRLL
jgi:hypothetical protein